MLLGTLLKVQQFIHYNKVAVKKQVNVIIQYKCMHDTYIGMAVSSFPPEPSYVYISGRIVHVISEKNNHISVYMIATAICCSIFLSSRTYMSGKILVKKQANAII